MALRVADWMMHKKKGKGLRETLDLDEFYAYEQSLAKGEKKPKDSDKVSLTFFG